MATAHFQSTHHTRRRKRLLKGSSVAPGSSPEVKKTRAKDKAKAKSGGAKKAKAKAKSRAKAKAREAGHSMGRAVQCRAGQGKAWQGRAGHGRARQDRAGQSRAGKGRAARAGQVQAGQGMAMCVRRGVGCEGGPRGLIGQPILKFDVFVVV